MNDYLQIKELYHHGIKGQKWGIRRYQNEDGTLTDEGRRKYGTVERLEKTIAKKETKEKIKTASKDYYNERTNQKKIISKDLYGKHWTNLSKEELNVVISNAEYNAKKIIQQKYGNETYQGMLKREENIKIGATAAASALAIAGTITAAAIFSKDFSRRSDKAGKVFTSVVGNGAKHFRI